MTTRRRQVDELSAVDREAMARAIEILRREPARDNQLDYKLKHESFEAVGGFAAYSCQCNALSLKPWQVAPASVASAADIAAWSGGDDIHGWRAAALLALRLQSVGLSKYEPDPLSALERVEGRAPSVA